MATLAPPQPTQSTVTADFALLRRRPPAVLAGLVTDIVHYRETARGDFRQVETASLTVPLIFSFGETMPIGLGREPGPQDGHDSFTSGLYAGPAIIRSTGRMECLQVNFTPLGAWRFFQLPMQAIAGRMVALSDIADAGLRDLEARLADLPSPEARLDCATAHVIRRIAAAPASDPLSEAAIRLIRHHHGDIRIGRLAQKLDRSRKHLADRFRETVGVSPKTLARMMRFNRAQALARAGGDWADVAAACGYADQAHLAREFQEMAGAPPAAWLSAA